MHLFWKARGWCSMLACPAVTLDSTRLVSGSCSVFSILCTFFILHYSSSEVAALPCLSQPEGAVNGDEPEHGKPPQYAVSGQWPQRSRLTLLRQTSQTVDIHCTADWVVCVWRTVMQQHHHTGSGSCYLLGCRNELVVRSPVWVVLCLECCAVVNKSFLQSASTMHSLLFLPQTYDSTQTTLYSCSVVEDLSTLDE